MKRLKKLGIAGVIGIVFVGMIVLFFPAKMWIFPYFHDLTQKRLSSALTSIPVPPNTEKIGDLNEVGQLAGNSDHCDYFTALLLKTGMSKSELEDYYRSKYKGESPLYTFWLDDKDNPAVGPDYVALHPLKDWFVKRPQNDLTNVVIYIYDSGITSSFDRRCS